MPSPERIFLRELSEVEFSSCIWCPSSAASGDFKKAVVKSLVVGRGAQVRTIGLGLVDPMTTIAAYKRTETGIEESNNYTV